MSDTVYCGDNCKHTGPHRFRSSVPQVTMGKVEQRPSVDVIGDQPDGVYVTEESLARALRGMKPCGAPDCPDRHFGWCDREVAAILAALMETSND